MSALAAIESVGALQHALDEFSIEYTGLEQLIDGLFGQLDGLHEQLNRKAEELAGQRRLAEQREAQISEREKLLAEQREENQRLGDRLDLQEARLSEALEALGEIKSRLTSHPVEKTGEPGEFDEKRSELQRQLAAASDELSRLTSVAADLTKMREEMLQFRAESPSGAGDAAPGGDLNQLERERASLEAELELVRSRAAELQETVDKQKQEMSARHVETTDELRRLRELVERQAELANSSSVASPPAANNREGEPAPASNDPVVSSVMAQFAKIQKDVARRKNQR